MLPAPSCPAGVSFSYIFRGIDSTTRSPRCRSSARFESGFPLLFPALLGNVEYFFSGGVSWPIPLHESVPGEMPPPRRPRRFPRHLSKRLGERAKRQRGKDCLGGSREGRGLALSPRLCFWWQRASSPSCSGGALSKSSIWWRLAPLTKITCLSLRTSGGAIAWTN